MREDVQIVIMQGSVLPASWAIHTKQVEAVSLNIVIRYTATSGQERLQSAVLQIIT